jgi:tyrosyl-DNA phosphodiesterase 1
MIIATLDNPDSQREPSEEPSVSGTEDESDDEIVEVDRNGMRKGKNTEPARPYGWAYVGSHNFTPSAWGTLSGSGFTPILNVRRIYRGLSSQNGLELTLDNELRAWNRVSVANRDGP